MNIKFPSFAKAMEGKQISNIKIKILLWLAILLFIGIFSYLSIKRYKTLNSYYYDLGIMNQVVYNTSRGRFLEMTNQDLKKNVSRLAIHFDPILAVFAPFYLLYFAVQRAVLFDFHAVTLVTTFFLFALYFNLIKKNFWYFIFILLSLLTKEHVGLAVFFLGMYLCFIKKEKKTGIITAILGIIFFVTTVYVIIPYFRGTEHFAAGYFVDIRSRLPDIFKNGISYILLLVSPLFYSLFSPLTLLISLPEWAINILSINSNQRSIYFHYNSVIVAFLFYSLILGYKNFDKKIKNKIIKGIYILFF